MTNLFNKKNIYELLNFKKNCFQLNVIFENPHFLFCQIRKKNLTNFLNRIKRLF